jgi:hypothetical protein
MHARPGFRPLLLLGICHLLIIVFRNTDVGWSLNRLGQPD